jgi:hypothetical protein
MSDYDSRRRNQTCIQNAELDGLIRTLKPALSVKIVDACHSGVSYIKSPEDFRNYLEKSAQEGFQKLYFMFSSQSDQSSYQDNNLSDFTRKNLECIHNYPAETVRYKDIIDYVSDAFQGETAQTPFFVTQADFTETFVDMSPALKLAADEALGPVRTSIVVDGGKGFTNILTAIKKDAERYCDENEANERLDSVTRKVEAIKPPQDLASLYDFTVLKPNSVPPNPQAIGRWIDSNKDDREYFVRVRARTLTFNRPAVVRPPPPPPGVGTAIRPATSAISAAPTGPTGPAGPQPSSFGGSRQMTDEQRVIEGYDSTVKLPYHYISVNAEPKLPNINKGVCFIVPILSMTHIRIFWATSLYVRVGWDNTELTGELAWKTGEAELKGKDASEQLVNSILEEFIAFLQAMISEKWGSLQATREMDQIVEGNEMPQNVDKVAADK